MSNAVTHYTVKPNGTPSEYRNEDAIRAALPTTLYCDTARDVRDTLLDLETRGVEAYQTTVTAWCAGSEPALGNDIYSSDSGEEWLLDYEQGRL